jgi:tetratricopeptide (TPR) repeat protein
MAGTSTTDQTARLRERLKLDPEDLAARAGLIRLLAGSSNERELTGLVEKGIRLDPGDVHLANAVLVAAAKSDSVFAKAVTSYEAAESAGPMPKVNLANLLSLKADDKQTMGKMRTLVDDALALDEGCYEAHLAAHTVYGAQGDLVRSLEHLERAVGLAPRGDPKLPTLVLGLGQRLADAGRHEDAIRLLYEAVRAYGNSPTVGSSITHIAYTTIGLALLEEGNPKAALEALERSRSVSVDPIIRSSGLRPELANKLAAAGHEAAANEFLDLAARVKEMPVGTWLGKRFSSGYLGHLYRAAALPITTLLVAVLGWMVAGLLLRHGVSVVPWRFAVGFVLFGYGLLVLRGALSRRLVMSTNQRWGYIQAGLGFIVGGGLWALVGWIQGLIALAILVLWGIATLARAQPRPGGARAVR